MRAAEVSTIVDEQLDLQRPNEQADTGALGGAPDQTHHICSRDQQPRVGSPVDVRPAVLQRGWQRFVHFAVKSPNAAVRRRNV